MKFLREKSAADRRTVLSYVYVTIPSFLQRSQEKEEQTESS